MPLNKPVFPILIFICLLLFSFNGYAQETVNDYDTNIQIGDSLYQAGQFKEASQHYSIAFKANNGKGLLPDRFKAAKSWSQSNIRDSAFYNLFLLVNKANYADFTALEQEEAFNNLKKDQRWKVLVKKSKQNGKRLKEFSEIRNILEAILQEDQNIRVEMEKAMNSNGTESDEFKKIVSEMKDINKEHVQVVEKIIDKHGWLGKHEVGSVANIALSVIIIHSPTEVKEKYLPLMEKAFEQGRIDPKSYVFIKDKVSLAKTGKQIYGSQVQLGQDGKYSLYPILDIEKVNERRAKIDVGPLEEYLLRFGIKEY